MNKILFIHQIHKLRSVIGGWIIFLPRTLWKHDHPQPKGQSPAQGEGNPSLLQEERRLPPSKQPITTKNEKSKCSNCLGLGWHIKFC